MEDGHAPALTGQPVAPPRADQAAPFWNAPWGFPQAVTIAVGFIGIAAILQVIHPGLAGSLPGYPWNWLIVYTPLVFASALRIAWPEQVVFRGLGGIPMAIISIVSVALLAAPAAIWPQGADAPDWLKPYGLNDVFRSLPFAAAGMLLLVNLALCTAVHLWPMDRRNIQFALVHGGILIAIGSGFAGSSTMIRSQLLLYEGGGFSRQAVSNGELLAMPFGIQLKDFRMESFSPTLTLATSRGSDSDIWDLSQGSEMLATGVGDVIGEYAITVNEYIEQAAVYTTVPRAFSQEGAGPAALVSVSHARTGEHLGSGWLHAPTQWGGELFLQLSESNVLLMSSPKPKLFESRVLIRDSAGEEREALVQVNKPVKVDGWRLYQLSYDESRGAASTYSVIEAVRDPAYPAVATGCWMVTVGCLLFVWGAARRLTPQAEEEAG